MAAPYQMSGPTFAFCGTFSGAGNISASRWLMKFEHEMSGYRKDNLIPPDKYLSSLNMLLTDEAAEWSESHPDAIRLLNDPNPTQDTVDSFKSLFCDRFPSRVVEVVPIPIDVELAELRQKQDETLAAYYKRVTGLMQRVGARDRPVQSPSAHTPGSTLSSLESAMLDTILRAFIRGLSEPEIRREATRGMTSPDRSLKTIYQLAEEARRTNIEIQKLYEEEVRQDELSFYRDLAQQSIPQAKIEAMLTQYHSARSRPKASPWSIHMDPHPQSGYVPDRPQSAFRPLAPSYGYPGDRPQSAYRPPPPPAYVPDRPQSTSGPPPMTTPDRPPLAPTSRGNEVAKPVVPPLGPPPFAPAPQKSRLFQPTPKDLPDRSESRNPWINGTKKWSFAQGRLCVRCGHIGHTSRECTDDPLPSWEQSHLKEIVFGQSAQVNHLSAYGSGYGQEPRPYGHPMEQGPTIMSRSTSNTEMSGAIQTPDSSSPVSSSIGFGIAGLSVSDRLNTPQPLPRSLSSPEVVPHAVVNYGESSGPNKRPFVEEPRPVQNPAVPLPMPPPATTSGEDRRRRKGQKRVVKKVEPQPVVGMFNETLGKYDTPISIRQVLKANKVDISWMDLIAWSPGVCREIKRMCTRVAKKRAPKVQQGPTMGYPQPGFVPQQAAFLPQNFPQPMPAQFMQPMATQQFQNFQQPIVPGPTGPQILQNPGPSAPPPANSAGEILSVSAGTRDDEKHTQFLSTMIGMDKAFRIPCSVVKPNGETVTLNKQYTQADQGSDMNVISMDLARRLNLQLRDLAEVGFRGLSMRTADNHDTILYHWVWVRVSVADILRDIRCFVAPKITQTTAAGQVEHLSLILGLPWLYSVDASISIRKSKITIGDVSIGETVREVVGPELVFCKDHNLLMYPKSAMASSGKMPTVEDESDSSSSDSSDDLSDVEDPSDGDF